MSVNSSADSVCYHFLDFNVSRQRQVLSKNGESISLSTKLYYLLLTFVQKPGQVLTKDQIINAVWPDQIVTDAALTKQILRLRKALNDTNLEQPIIETHRGVGYRFSAPVTVSSETQTVNPEASGPETARSEDPGSSSNSPRSRGFSLIALLVLLAIIVYLVVRPELTTNSNAKIETNAETKADTSSPAVSSADVPVRVAIIPSKKTQDWLNKGGLRYLSDLLTQHKLIHAISPEPEWYDSVSSEKLAIDLSTVNNINYSCLIDIGETESGYTIHISLRTKDQIVSSVNLEADTLPELFDKSDAWISSSLSIHDNFDGYNQAKLSTVDPYALQSYLQGLLTIDTDGNQQKGLEYFQAAINKDPEFLLAWVRLAGSYMELGNQEKAISIANTLLQRTDIQEFSNASLELHYIKAMAYIKLRDHERAKQSIDVSESYIKQLDDPYQKLVALKSLVLLAKLQEDWGKAESYALESLALSEQYYALPVHLADIQLALAEIYQRDARYTQMHEYINQAIHNYQSANNANGMIASFSLLNLANFIEGKFDAGAKIASRAEPYLENNTSPHELVNFLQGTILMLNLRGYFDRSDRYINKMRDIAEQTNNSFYALLAEYMKLHMYYVQNRFQQARNQADVLVSMLDNDNILPSVQLLSYTGLLLAASRADPPAEANIMLQAYKEKYPLLKEKYLSGLERAEGHIAVRLGYVNEGLEHLRKAQQGYARDHQKHLSNYVGYEVLEVLIDYPELEYKQELAQLWAATEYDYLLYKLKAQFSARENDFLNAALIMQENKLRANQLWKAEDQLLLEEYQNKAN